MRMNLIEWSSAKTWMCRASRWRPRSRPQPQLLSWKKHRKGTRLKHARWRWRFWATFKGELGGAPFSTSPERFHCSSRLAHPSVLKWYIWVLGDYETNPPDVNHAALKLLHKVAFQLKSVSLLYQASLFRVFQRVQKLVGFKSGPIHQVIHTSECLAITSSVLPGNVQHGQAHFA